MASLVQYNYIVAVDTYRHFATAAEKSFVTQPTLSMQIKKLEDELGILIFDRSKQPVMPTEIGEKVIEQVRKILAENQRLDEIIQEEKGSISGHLSIGIIPTIAPYLLPKFIGRFSKKYPKIQIKIQELLTEDIIDYLHRDLLDVGILVTPLDEEGIEELPMYYEEMLMYVHRDHAFYERDDIQPSDIATPDIRLLTDGHCFRSQIVNLCSYHHTNLESSSIQWESGSIDTIMKMVDFEGGYTLIPELTTSGLSATQQQQIKHFDKTTPLREVSLVYSRHFLKKRLIRLFSDSIIDAIPKKLLDKSRGELVGWK